MAKAIAARTATAAMAIPKPAVSRLRIHPNLMASLREGAVRGDGNPVYWSSRKSITRAPLATASRVLVSAPISLR